MAIKMSKSKGEEIIHNLLIKNRILFSEEISFKGLNGCNNTPLRFDFAIFTKSKKIWALIEFDGQQHFQFTPYFHKSKEDFHKQLEYDKKKNKFCLKNKIPLYRIPYWEIDNLTINKLFDKKFLVKNKNHNLLLKNSRGDDL